VGGAVVGNGRDGEVVPELAGRALFEVRVGVREEGGVDEGFLSRISSVVWLGYDATYLVEGSCPLPLPY
jgi:hypothetical protein